MVPSQKCGRCVFFKGRGAFSKIWSSVPFTKVVGHILAKVAGHILTKVAECFILKKLGWALLEYLGWPLILQKAGLGRIFSLLTLAPSSQHLGKQSRAKGVEVRREAKPNIQIFGVPIPPILADGRQMVKAQATDSLPRFLEVNVHVMEASQGNK
ncbi:unnamed protein product [Prunus armeniaca]